MKPALAAAVQLNAVSAMSGLLVARDVASITIASGWISPAELAYYRAAYGNLPSEPSRKIRKISGGKAVQDGGMVAVWSFTRRPR